jgi:hypothetical protein
VLGNGGPLVDRNEPIVVLESDGNRFRNVTFSAGLPLMGKGHGINGADLFGNGAWRSSARPAELILAI